MTSLELEERYPLVLKEVKEVLTLHYTGILTSRALNRDQKVGYIVAATTIDSRYNLGWMALSLAVEIVTHVIDGIMKPLDCETCGKGIERHSPEGFCIDVDYAGGQR